VKPQNRSTVKPEDRRIAYRFGRCNPVIPHAGKTGKRFCGETG
jgi:hypothetical protein